MVRKLLAVYSVILASALVLLGPIFPNFYLISGLVTMIAVIWIFYWADKRFKLGYEYRHYVVLILLFTLGVALNPLFYIWTPYDKVLHFFTPLLWCTLIFVPVKKFKLDFFLKVIFTVCIFLSIMMVHEVGEYALDKGFDLHLQGVQASSFSENFDRQTMVDVQNPWDDTMQDELLDIFGALAFGALNFLSYSYRGRELI